MEVKRFTVHPFYKVTLITMPLLFIGFYSVLYFMGGEVAFINSIQENYVVLAILLLFEVYFASFRVSTVEITPKELKFKRYLGKSTSYDLRQFKQVSQGKYPSLITVEQVDGEIAVLNVSSFRPQVIKEIITAINKNLK